MQTQSAADLENNLKEDNVTVVASEAFAQNPERHVPLLKVYFDLSFHSQHLSYNIQHEDFTNNVSSYFIS